MDNFEKFKYTLFEIEQTFLADLDHSMSNRLKIVKKKSKANVLNLSVAFYQF